MISKEKLTMETGFKIKKFDGKPATIKSLRECSDSAGKVMQALDASISACKAWLKTIGGLQGQWHLRPHGIRAQCRVKPVSFLCTSVVSTPGTQCMSHLNTYTQIYAKLRMHEHDLMWVPRVEVHLCNSMRENLGDSRHLRGLVVCVCDCFGCLFVHILH